MSSIMELMQKQETLSPELSMYLEDTDIWPVLRHPLVFAVPYTPQLNAVYNESYNKKSEYLEECRKKGEWVTYIFLHERPYRFMAFTKICEDIQSDEKYWDLFGNVWVDSENIWQNIPYIRIILKSRRPKREFMMDEKEREFLRGMSDSFTIYRGHTKKNRRGYSWTLDRDKAEWFASRFKDKNASVSSAICRKENVIAVFLGRNESEVVVDPSHIKIKKPHK